MSQSYKIADAVFEGGGVKCMALVGALKVMEEAGYRWNNLAGTSGGSIIASLLSVGYNSTEIKSVMEETGFNELLDKSFLTKIPLVGKAGSLLINKGLYKGDTLKNWISKLLIEKYTSVHSHLSNGKEVTFGDLIIKGEKGILLNNPKYKKKYKLHIIATDITNGRMLILPEDIADYGINPDNLSVSLAVRMSLSIPFFFEPVKFKNTETCEKCFIVDGGVLSNYPIWIFDTNTKPLYSTIGFKLGGLDKNSRHHEISNTLNLASALIETMLEAQDDIHIEEANYARTIKIDTSFVDTTEFNLSKEKINMLYDSGVNYATKFLKSWDDSYVKLVQTM